MAEWILKVCLSIRDVLMIRRLCIACLEKDLGRCWKHLQFTWILQPGLHCFANFLILLQFAQVQSLVASLLEQHATNFGRAWHMAMESSDWVLVSSLGSQQKNTYWQCKLDKWWLLPPKSLWLNRAWSLLTKHKLHPDRLKNYPFTDLFVLL